MRTCAAEKWPHELARVRVYKVKVLTFSKVDTTMADVPENAPEGKSFVVYGSPLDLCPLSVTRLSRDTE